MASESNWFLSGKRLLCSGRWAMGSDPLKAVLLTGDYIPDYEQHKLYSDIKGGEAVGLGYPKGGIRLTDLEIKETLGEIHLHAKDIVLPEATISACAVAIVHSGTGTLICYNYGGQQESFEAKFKIGRSEEGVLWF